MIKSVQIEEQDLSSAPLGMSGGEDLALRRISKN